MATASAKFSASTEDLLEIVILDTHRDRNGAAAEQKKRQIVGWPVAAAVRFDSRHDSLTDGGDAVPMVQAERRFQAGLVEWAARRILRFRDPVAVDRQQLIWP